jgi:hypothetical protein
VSFDIPYPPNYGGVIDVYYKIRNLNSLGIDIILHCFEYGREHAKELEKYCKKVNYYIRDMQFTNLISRTPYIVKTRQSKNLINNLLKDSFPILFEGLHTTYPLTTNKFNNRKTFVRTHNIEHNYYNGLKHSENKISKKLFFQLESIKLKKYENSIQKADHILTISPFEHAYFKKHFGDKATYVPVFFDLLENKNTLTSNIFSLWHGDLTVADNRKSLEYIINIYKGLSHKLVIASNHIEKNLLNSISKIENISFKKINSYDELQELIKEAHIHPLVSYQKTGIKLRLLNILSQGKHIIANDNIIEDTGLETCVHIANDIKSFRNKITELVPKKFLKEDIEIRNEYLKLFNPKNSAQLILDLLE